MINHTGQHALHLLQQNITIKPISSYLTHIESSQHYNHMYIAKSLISIFQLNAHLFFLVNVNTSNAYAKYFLVSSVYIDNLLRNNVSYCLIIIT